MNSPVFAGLGLLARNLRRLAQVPAASVGEVSRALNDTLDRQRAAGTDPYGRPHAPLARPRPGGAPLDRTGQSYSLTRFRPLSGAGIGITLGGWLSYHMRATKNRPARRVLPAGALPPAWLAAIESAVRRRATEAGVR